MQDEANLLRTSAEAPANPESAADKPQPEYEAHVLLQRPESAVLIVFAVLFLLWDVYVAILEETAPANSLSGRALVHRLAVDPSTISRRKHREDFSAWTQNLDPEKIAWVYQAGRFLPLTNAS